MQSFRRSLMRGSFFFLLYAGTAWAASPIVASSAVGPDPVAVEIERRFADKPDIIKIDAESLDGLALRDVYQPRGWRPLWSDGGATVLPILAVADQHGLALAPLHLAAIEARAAAATPQKRAENDLLLTDAVLRYAMAMRGQRVDPGEIEDDWFVATPPFDPVAFLIKNATDIGPALQALSAPYAAYQALKRSLADLRAVAASGDWPKVPSGPPLKPDGSDDRVPAIRRRLRATGELAAPDHGDESATLYDAALQDAVRLFQDRHGLEHDAVVGGRTLAALNVSAADRARQVAVNMERWRWLPQKLERDHIVVNVPAAEMEVVENGNAVLAMRVVVGDADHPTPALHATLTSLVLNPIWRIPASIATDEILPKLKKDAGYLMANDLELVSDSFVPGSPESQGAGIAWHQMTSMPWPIRQRAGSDNALGRIKFNIPNSDDIYLHDTPNRKAFTRAVRALSHGCVRLERPEDLALYLLKDWTRERLEAEIDKGETKSVPVRATLPVWLLYWTAWVDADGVLQFRDDIYGRDQRLAAALARANHAPHIIARQPTLAASTGGAATVGVPSAPAARMPAAQTPSVTTYCEGCRIP